MECKHAYFKAGINYVLCKCQGEPASESIQDLTRCLCGHQKFCRQIRSCSLLPTWRDCIVKKQHEEEKLEKAMANAMIELTDGAVPIQAPPEKKRSTRKRK